MLQRLMACLLVSVPALAQTVAAPAMTIRLSRDHILLGEPVWVQVMAHNRSAVTVQWNPDNGWRPTEQPVTARVPDAAVGNGKRERCTYGGGAGNHAGGGGGMDLAPGDSAVWLDLLEGDFHFVHAGTYQVELTSHPERWVLRAREDTTPAPDTSAVTRTLVTLYVLPRNDAALLRWEKQMAAEADSELRRFQGAFGGSDAERTAAIRESQGIDKIRRGLAEQPAPGMEEVFAEWLRKGAGELAIVGLKNLNTSASRAALAEIAKTPGPPYHTQWAAVNALGPLGDSKYYPLMVQLLTSPDDQVRRSAISGVGYLGGDAGVTTLLRIAHAGSPAVQEDAMMSLGNTQSHTGVRSLIDLMAAPDIANPTDAEWWLFILTHHRLEPVSVPRTTAQTHEAWEQWWKTGGKNARVYSPFECAP